jgi:DedD protein
MRHAAVYEEEDFAEGGPELSLGMGTLLGIFFGLALVCGVFFGFGYMMGHRTPGAYVSSEPLYVAPKPVENPITPKPSALVPEQPADASRVVLPRTQGNVTSTPPPQVQQKAPPQRGSVDAPEPTVTRNVAAAPIPVPAPATVQPAGASSGNGSIMVQIAAVKNLPDAEALANALRKNGFSPTIRPEPEDKLLHVQVGPFNNRDDAKAMRQKLSSAGYDAFIK